MSNVAFPRSRFRSLAIVMSCVAVVAPSQGSRSAANTTCAPPTLIANCLTTAVHTYSTDKIQIICLNPCALGCTKGVIYVPGSGTGSYCKCSIFAGPACCHLVAGYNDGDDSAFFTTDGDCGGACPATTCAITFEEIDRDHGNYSAGCE